MNKELREYLAPEAKIVALQADCAFTTSGLTDGGDKELGDEEYTPWQ